MTDAAPVIALRDATKRFGPVEVLHDVDLEVRAGEVLALIGENGAGKSTAMKCLAGYQPLTSGRILLDGKEVTFGSLHAGEEAGIVLIHQEFNLAEQLTVEQNIFLGRELRKGLFLDKARMRQLSRDYLDRVKCEVDPDRVVSSLSNSEKQMVEIAKALGRDARVLVMDEPTAVLTNTESRILFDQVRALKAAGTAIIFTSHKLSEVSEIADRVTVMRDGAVVHDGPVADMTEDAMATAMVGRDVSDLYPPKGRRPDDAPVMLKVEGLSVPRFAEDVSFELRRGEILGIAGLVGSGRTEAMEGLCGLRPASAARIEIDGAPVAIRRPADALSHGLCYLTEDRKLKGLLLEKGMRVNLTLQSLEKFGGLMVDRQAEEKALDAAIREFDIRGGQRESRVSNLSGGNQQKLLLAKVMQSEPRILVVDEPTRGIDIGTKQQIYTFLRRLADEGRAIIVISSEMQEVIGLSDRVLVMRRGRVAGMLEGEAITEDAIVRHAMGVGADSQGRAA
ncbi:sugar ABC transporter ATP-binding protein [Silicimonas algicola]|uniref:Monosaccharide ABC transporter ATP-binding protein (CUT2 family) n=1 Tax=Silicimonas algicola TaxID=1826607 RepID=A0A316GEK1_9RHOB|nr:sugar ABC transporter ATP-binding protein [Silicimonas algicola]AZQ66645.1 sugar ABC transporter ATP-binding protein [Silicimonas algicola]PWK58993.1 monosaccharide ABC transporter ATP-binding protein (CUT2 family) [Silicimonas algicola]